MNDTKEPKSLKEVLDERKNYILLRFGVTAEEMEIDSSTILVLTDRQFEEFIQTLENINNNQSITIVEIW